MRSGRKLVSPHSRLIKPQPRNSSSRISTESSMVGLLNISLTWPIHALDEIGISS